MLDLIRELFPICRSIAGEGIRATLRRVGQEIPLQFVETPTGTPVLDWVVPREWTLRRATLARTSGELVIDSDRHNLHVLNYSIAFRGRVGPGELARHLHSMPEKPDWIPYRTSYYNPTWGLCCSEADRRLMNDAEYDVDIDVELKDGSLTYAECFIPGTSDREVLFSCHSCHPSLVNDNLAGIAVATELAKWLGQRAGKLSYRLVFLPGTIGSITWLARNPNASQRIVAGLVLSCLGDRGVMHYKRSRRETSATDRIIEQIFADRNRNDFVRDFVPYGYDERQYCSPGFNLPVGCLMRTPNGEYPQYHSSADDVSVVDHASLDDSLDVLKSFVGKIEAANLADQTPSSVSLGTSDRYMNLSPRAEPMLGRRGLYAAMGGRANVPELQMAMLWVLNYSDGLHGIDWIAVRSKLSRETIAQAVELLAAANLLAPA